MPSDSWPANYQDIQFFRSTMSSNLSKSCNTIIISPSYLDNSKSGIAQLTKSLHTTFHGSLIYGHSNLSRDIKCLHPVFAILPYHARLLIAYNLYILKRKLANPQLKLIITSVEYLPLPFLLGNKDELFFQDFIQLFYPRNPFVWFLYLYGLLAIILCSFQVQSCSESSIRYLKPLLSRKRVKIYRHNLMARKPVSRISCRLERDIDILWLGTTANHKNLKLFLDAVRVLNARDINLSCAIKIDNNLKRSQLLEDAIGELSQTIHVITSQIDEAELTNLYHRSKIFVSTSLMEGYCIPIRTSALCGAIPLISNIASFREIHSTYSYFHDLTPVSLAFMIENILDDIALNPSLNISTRHKSREAMENEMKTHSGVVISFD